MKEKGPTINKELQFKGKILSLVIPNYSKQVFKLCRPVLNLLFKGKWNSKVSTKTDIYIERENKSPLRCCICKSKTENVTFGTGVLWIHGGGYGLGVPEVDRRFIDTFIECGNCVVFSPDYTLSIDAPYPQALEDCYTALLWMKNNSEQLGINPKQIFIGGDSAGGGLCAALALYARNKKEVAVAFQMPLYPMLNDQNADENDAPVWNSKSNKEAWNLYLGESKEVPIYAAPSRCDDFSALPPTITYIGTIEVFYKETVEYVKRLKEAGVEVFFEEFEGCYHGFDIVAPKSEAAKKAHQFLKTTFKYAQQNYFQKQPK